MAPTRRTALHLAALLLAAALAACGDVAGDAPGSDPAVSAVDDAGRQVALPRPAQRVVSLVPSYTDAVVAMGAGGRLVARTDYDRHAKLAKLPSVGGGLDPSLEVLAGLQPDLVVAWQERSPRLSRRLEEMGIAVFSVQTQDTTDALRGIERMGILLGEEAAAGELLADLRGRLDAVRVSVAGRPSRSVLYLVGIDPPRTAGPETFPLQLVGLAGGETVFDDVSGWPQVSLEAIVRRDPDVILLPTGGHEARVVERLREMPVWRDLRAVREGRVLPLPVDTVNRPGPAMGRSAELLRNAIHPADDAG